MLPKLEKLKSLCDDLDLEVKSSGKKISKSDYILSLRNHYLPEGGLLYKEITPMLCFPEWNLKESEKEFIWNSSDWIIERKLNGCRLILHFVKNKGVFAHSRTISLKNYRYQELTDHLLIKDFIPNRTFSLDVEVLVDKEIDTSNYTYKGNKTKSSLHSTISLLHIEAQYSLEIQKKQNAPLQFYVFDIMNSDGIELTKYSLEKRLDYLNDFKKWMKNQPIQEYFKYLSIERGHKKKFFEKIILDGGEGVILKNLKSRYENNSSRLRTGWIKVKKKIEVDAFVTGFIRGKNDTDYKNLIGALEFSVILETGEIHPIAICSNLILSERKKYTIYDENSDTVQLIPEVYGMVAEVSGQDITARSLKLSHAVIERWRNKGPDLKLKEDCRMEKNELKKLSDWVGA